MLSVLTQTAVLIAVGIVWRRVKPWGLDPDVTRRVLTGLVYIWLLPALVLDVLWRAPLGLDAARIAVSAALGVAVGFSVAWGWFRIRGTPRRARGALLLAAAFGNVTYLGLPVLESTFGGWARSVAIQYDLFACTPLLLTAGILAARAHGDAPRERHPVAGLAAVPALWAAALAVALNLSGVVPPSVVGDVLGRLADGVVPLMLVAIGLALEWDREGFRRIPAVLPVLGVRFAVAPIAVWTIARLVGLEGQTLQAVVLEASMPSMVLGVVICDRYGLDTGLYAVAVTFSTSVSVLTLPLWYLLVS